MEMRHPGRMPQLPAVGAATIRPMAALQPATASALVMALERKPPHKVFPCFAYSPIRQPSPPVRPDMERRSRFMPSATESRMTMKSCFIRS